MNVFVRYIINSIIELFRQQWYKHKMRKMKEKQSKLEETVNESKSKADQSVTDFESAYRMYEKRTDKVGEQKGIGSGDGDNKETKPGSKDGSDRS